MVEQLKIAIVGGGAAGFFAAINAAWQNPHALIEVFEGSSRVLTKVLISGGGRCNVTHHCFEPKKLVANYPRGSRELLGPFTKFGPLQTIEWFNKLGVKLIAEKDGRMFPSTNSSHTIADTLKKSAEEAGVTVHLRRQAVKITKEQNGFMLTLHRNEPQFFHKVLLATGSAPVGYRLAKNLGHTVTDLAPSLFTFSIEDVRLQDLAGLAFDEVKLQLVLGLKKKEIIEFSGPLLITHWGLSGPAILKLSAWGARELFDRQYQAELSIDFLPQMSKGVVREILVMTRKEHNKKKVMNLKPFSLPRRYWNRLIEVVLADKEILWGQLNDSHFDILINQLCSASFKVSGKGTFKEEFVTCGGISLKEVDFRYMESKKCAGLYFAGEILDVDGITGGFNFQNAWTTGWHAAQHIAKHN